MAFFRDKELLKKVADFQLADVHFPTDRISVGDIRKVAPRDFEWDFEQSNSFVDRDSFSVLLDDALHYERKYALFAWCERKNVPSQELTGFRLEDKDELIRMLHQSYRDVGMVKDMQAIISHVRDIESQITQKIAKQQQSR